MAVKHWMQEAFSKHPGKFTAKAKAAGKSVGEYAREHLHSGGALGKEARLAALAKKLANRKKHK